MDNTGRAGDAAELETAEFDVVVVGSGAGGMVAAIRAHDLGMSALVVEKTDKFGGTSAMSGGGIWVPNTEQSKRAGFKDSYDEAFRYVKAASRQRVPDSRIHAYLQHALKLEPHLHAKTHLH